ncbi:hypothetical protein ACHAWC_008874 [Mediolabrus comicus]
MSSKPADANLATLLRYFVGIDLIVETKHGRSLKGSLVSADSMNIVLKNRQKEALTTSATTTTTTTNTGGTESFDWVHIRGPTIRYIVFGANIDLAGVIKAGKDRERAASDKYRRGIRKAPNVPRLQVTTHTTIVTCGLRGLLYFHFTRQRVANAYRARYHIICTPQRTARDLSEMSRVSP